MASHDSDITLYANLNADEIKSTAEDIQGDIETIFSRSKGHSSPALDAILSKLAEVYAKSQSVMDKMTELEGQTFNTDQYDAVLNMINKLEAKYTELFNRKNELIQQEEQLKQVQVPTQEYAEVQKQIDETQTRLDKLLEKQDKFLKAGGKTSSKGYKALQNDIEEARNTIKYAKGELAELEKQGKATQVTPEYEKTAQELAQVRQEILAIIDEQDKWIEKKQELEATGQATYSGAETEEYEKLSQSLGSLNNKMMLLKQKAAEVAPAIASAFAMDHPVLYKMGSIFGGLISKIGQLAGAVGKLVFTKVVSGLKQVNTHARNAASNLAKMVGSGIISGIKKLGSAMSGLGKNTHKSNGMFEHGFKTFIRYGLGARSLFALVNKLRRALIAGMGDLAKVSEPFNVAVSNILTSLKMLRNSFASAFSPIIEVVSPILVKFINLASEVVTKIGMMIAALTGKTSYMRALPVYQDYAKSLDSSSKSANKAAKSTKKLNKEEEELKKTLAGFDDVEILKNPDSGNDNSDLDTDLSDALDDIEPPAFEETPLGETFYDLSDLLKRAWEKADFTEVGKILGQKLLDALNKIPWNKIKKLARKIGKSIATLINGFLEVPGLFSKIGETIAQGLNSAFEFAEAFASNFHWDSLGKAILDGILGFINNIDWPLIYKTLAEYGAGIGTTLDTIIKDQNLWVGLFNSAGNLIEAILLGIDNFITSIDWGKTATSIATGLNDALANFNWYLLANTVVDAFNSVFDFWYNAVTTFDFHKFGEYIGTTLSEIINGINWYEGAASIGQTISGLYQAVNGFVETTDWGMIGHQIVQAVAGFFDNIDWGAIGKFCSNKIIAFFDLLTGIIDSIDWDALPDKVISAIKEFITSVDWTKTAESAARFLGSALRAAFTLLIKVGGSLWNAMIRFGKNVMNGGLEGIKEKLSAIGDWLSKHVKEPFINAFNKVFGIGSPSREMKPSGRYIVEGLFEGITDKLNRVGQWIKDNVFDPVIDGFESAFGIVSGIANSVKYVGQSIVTAVQSGISDNWHNIETWISDNAPTLTNCFEGIDWSSVGSNICSGISQGLSDGWDWLTESAWNLATDIYNSACNALDIGSPSKLFRKGIGRMIPEGLALGILDNEGVVETAMDKLNNAVVSTGQKALEIPAVVKGAVIPYQAKVSSQTESSLQDIVEALDYKYNRTITPEDLQSIIISAFQQYLNINFYLEDEQLARHANSGNLKLDRRYNLAR